LTVLSDYVARMVDVGMDQDEAMQIVAEIFAAGAANAAARPSAAALRMRKMRANKASQSVTCYAEKEETKSVTKRNEPSQSVTCYNTPLSSLKEDNRKRGARLSQDWSPSPEDRAFAKALGWSESQIDAEAANFRDYWIAKPGAGGTKLDWPATWRKWVRSSKVKPANQSPSTTSAPDKIPIEEAVRLYASNGYWSRHAPVSDVSQAPPEILAKHGLLPDGRRAA